MRLLLLFSVLLSCDSRPPNYGPIELKEMAKVGDPNLEVRVPKDFSEQLVDCSAYTPPCRYGLIVKVRNVEMRPLYYDDQDKALKAAKRIRGYVSRNWVFDDVAGEPVLEDFVKEYLHAVKAE